MSESIKESDAYKQARAQCVSVTAMVAALSVDYERLQELKDKAASGHFVAGFNMPGYMPDSEPAGFDESEDAREYLASEMEERAESLEDRTDSECLSDACMAGDYSKPDEMAQSLHEAAAHLRDMDDDGGTSAEFGATIAGTHYFLTFVPGLSDADESQELEEMSEAAGECTSEDEARERIQEDALSVEVRSGWQSPGETLEAEEFRIVLCTGGPHVELVGELNQHKEPDSVRVLYRDWSESGEFFDFDSEALLTYCRSFYFGE